VTTPQGIGCSLISGLVIADRSLRALMEFAENVLISATRFRRTAVFRFALSRSDLSRHHS